MTFKLNRREAIASGAAAGALAAAGPSLAASHAPKKGGTLRLGLSGANTSDNWDGRTHADIFTIVMGHGTVFDTLTMVGAGGQLEGSLAESWEASADAKTWTFNLRKGVTFHHGKPFGADDVIESLMLHTAEDSKSAAKPIVSAIAEMKKLTDHQVQFVLSSGNADLPYLLSDYHILMYPAGQVVDAIANGWGTGGYKVESFDPGVRALVSKYDGYYRDDICHFDGVEMIAMNDAQARTNALLTNQVDMISRMDFKTEQLIKVNPNTAVLEVTGNQHYTFPMLTDMAPYDNLQLRQALKHVFQRQELVDKILLGHGAIANDHPIGPANQFYHADLAQNSYDPDKAKSLLKKAGMEGVTLDLHVSDAAFAGATDASTLIQNSAKAAGININLVKEPADGYWSNVWLKKPWCACYWGGRATEDWMFSTAYESGVPWNDTRWENERFQSLLLEARTELDNDKRRGMYHEMQAICSSEGGVVVPMYANYVDAHSTKLANSGTIGNIWAMDSARVAERWWFA